MERVFFKYWGSSCIASENGGELINENMIERIEGDFVEEVIDTEQTSSKQMFDYYDTLDDIKIACTKNVITFSDVEKSEAATKVESDTGLLKVDPAFNAFLSKRNKKVSKNDSIIYLDSKSYLKNPHYNEFKDIYDQCTEVERIIGFRLTEDKKMAECILCGQNVTLVARSLSMHITSIHMRCVYCRKGVTTANLREHFNDFHKNRSVVKCLVCGEMINVVMPSDELVRHHYSHSVKHPDQVSFNCIYCHFKCSDKDELQEFRKREEHFRNTVCPICQAFGCRMQLHVHMITHKRKKFICEICNESYTFCELEAHKSTHITVDETCKKCQEKFTNKGDYEIHMIQHKKKAELKQCLVCQKTVTKRRFKSHMSIHSGTFKCSFCEICFNSNRNRKIHEYEHQNHELFQCSECSVVLRHKILWKMHLKKKHQIDFWEQEKRADDSPTDKK